MNSKAQELKDKSFETFSEALNQVRAYASNPDISKTEGILKDFLRSRVYQNKATLMQLKDTYDAQEFHNKSIIKKRIEILEDINNRYNTICGIDFYKNPLVTGSLRSNYSLIYEKEDMDTYSLFHEIKEYYKDLESPDKDRMDILAKIVELEESIKKPREELYNHERDYIKAYGLLLMNSVRDNNPDIEYLDPLCKDYIKLLTGDVSNHINYINRLEMEHTPKYEKDEFIKHVKENASIPFEERINGLDEEKKQYVDLSSYDIPKIYELLDRKEEVSEIKELLSSAEVTLESRNHNLVSIDTNSRIDYDDAISKIKEFIEFCDTLIQKYDDELNKQNYDELITKIETGIIEPPEVDVDKVEEKVEVIEEEKEEEKALRKFKMAEKLALDVDLDNTNELIVSQKGYSSDELDLSAFDLSEFKLVSAPKYDKLSKEEQKKVIDHVEKLRSLVGKSDSEKASIRATWPRMEDDQYVVPSNPSSAEIAVQKMRDSLRGMSSKIDMIMSKEENEENEMKM